jgi:hypothetical protein
MVNPIELIHQVAYNTVNNLQGAKLPSKELAEKIVDGRFVAKEKTYFVKSVFATKQKEEILNESTDKVVNVCNFNDGRTEGNRPFIALGIQVSEMANATINGAAYSPLLVSAAVKNGSILVSDDSNEILLDTPIQSLVPYAAPTKREDAFATLTSPMVLGAGRVTKIEPSLTAAAPANTNIQVAFWGIELYNRVSE